MMHIVKSWVRKDTQKNIIGQFFVILRVTFDGFMARGAEGLTQEQQVIAQEVNALFVAFERELSTAPDRHLWRIAYRIELYLVEFYPKELLELELQRRLEKAANYPLKIKVTWYKDQVAKTLHDASRQRGLLKALIDDMQWMYTNREEENAFRRSIRLRTSFLFFGASWLLGLMLYVLHDREAVRVMDLFVISSVVGWWGGTFSMLLGMQKDLLGGSLEDIKVFKSIWTLLFRSAIGMGAAMVFFFVVFAGILPRLESGLLPNGVTIIQMLCDGFMCHKGFLENQEIHKLFFWCFLAGFSEKLVPNILGAMEKKMADK